jgi:hypothetical protein
MALILLLSKTPAYSGQSGFSLDNEPLNIDSPIGKLGILYPPQAFGHMPYFIRYAGIKSPGDYYRYPRGAHKDSLSVAAKKEITSILQSTVKPDFYDEQIIGSLASFRYRLELEDSPREDFFVRYTGADTVYVISGWLGKFLSFYRAVPGTLNYDLRELQEIVSLFAAFEITIPKESYEKSSKDNPYFIEHIDREKMYRVRCYHISEQAGADKTTSHLVMCPYTLIEITKFIDKETMP